MTISHVKVVLGDSGPILLDFDGPVCSIFGGLPAPEVAERLRQVLSHGGVPLPAAVAVEADPLEMLRFSAHVGTHDLVLNVDNELRA